MLDKLPPEIVNHVADILDPKDLPNFLLVTKAISKSYCAFCLHRSMKDGQGTPIIRAAKTGNVALATRILDLDESRPDAASPWTKHYQFAVRVAAFNGKADIITLLLQRLPNLDVETADCCGNTALENATRRGHVDVLRILVNSGRVDKNKKNPLGDTAMRAAVESHHPNAVRALLELGADPRIRDAAGMTPAMTAARWGHADILDILAEHDRDIFLESDPGSPTSTLLVTAMSWGNVKAVHKLLEHGADFSHLGPAEVLRHAVDGGEPELVEEFLQQPTIAKEVNTPHDLGWTLLTAAILRGCKSAMIGALLRSGADPNLRNSSGMSPLTCALEKAEETLRVYRFLIGDPATVIIELLRAGADPNRRERSIDVRNARRGGSPLAEVAAKGRWRAVNHLVSLGDKVDWNAERGLDMAPLACAARNGELLIVQSLVEAGVDPNVAYVLDEDQLKGFREEEIARFRARECGPVAFIALGRGDVDMFRYLLRSGKVDLEAKDAMGRTLVQAAMSRESDNGEMMEVLNEVCCGLTEDDGDTIGIRA